MEKFMGKLMLPVLTAAMMSFTGCGGNDGGTVSVGDGMVSVVSSGQTDSSSSASKTPLPEGFTQINVATFLEDEYLNLAAQRFEDTYEGVDVNITAYAAGETRDLEGYINQMNTALMSGLGEDIIDVSRMSWRTLSERERLLDLSSFINFEPGEVFQNILDAYRFDGKWYTFPCRFTMEGYVFSDKYKDIEPVRDITLDRLIELAEKYPEARLISSAYGMGCMTLARQLFTIGFNDYVNLKDKTVDIENERFVSMLEKVKSLEDRLSMEEENDDVLILGYAVYGPASCSNGVLMYDDMFLLTDENNNSYFEKLGFMPALNANSKHHQLAADFIKFLLSEEMQSSPEVMFSPINKKAGAVTAGLMLESIKRDGYEPVNFDLGKNIELFNALVERTTTGGIDESNISSMADAEMERFFNGDVTAEQTAANLQSKLNTYLNE